MMDARQRRSRRAVRQGALRAAWNMFNFEHQHGSLVDTFKASRSAKNFMFHRDMTFAELLERAAQQFGDRVYVDYAEQTITFAELNRAANRIASGLLRAGIGYGDGVALMMTNHPRFLEAFFGIQKVGAYAVPINTALIGDGLSYICNHSESKAIFCDHSTAQQITDVRAQLETVRHYWISTAEAPADYALPPDMSEYEQLTHGFIQSGDDLGRAPDPDSPSLLLYTSGTTGLPKAVSTPYGNQRVKMLGLLAHFSVDEQDKLYTCLPLFHANALLLTMMCALWVGIPVRLAKRFSASRFWQDVAQSGATQFNTVGGMIPILLKTAPTHYDRQHAVKRVISAACPKDAWRPFEERFGVDIWEAYGAVDGAGVAITNFGNAPIGSLGKPAGKVKFRLVDEAGKEVGVNTPGELQVFVGHKKESKVQYFKNEKASNEKVQDGWLHTGDSMQKDEKGFLYFVGRNTDSMRRRGENVSAYEVEKQVDAHPDVLESAAFGVPAEVGEDDIMVCVVLLEGHELDASGLLEFLRPRLPKFALPRFIEVVKEIPKTGTHRVIKKDLKDRGVTSSTIDLDRLS